MCPVPTPGEWSGLPAPVVSMRLCSQPLRQVKMAVSRLSHRAHLAAGSSTDSCPHAASSAGRGGREIREPRATARPDGAGARTQAPCRGWGASSGPAGRAVLCCAVVQGLPPAQHNPEPSPLLARLPVLATPLPQKVLSRCSANRTISMATAFEVSYLGCFPFRIFASQQRSP